MDGKIAVRNPPKVNPREMIDPAADGHLSNWARWMQNYEVGIGYDNKSAVVTGYGSTSIDDMYAEMDRQHAKIANVVIEALTPVQQCAIHNVYIADVWKLRGDPVETFVEAAAMFWEMAQKRGLE